MTRTLDLRPDCLEETSSVDVTIVGATMLWPTDIELRRRAIEIAKIELALQSGDHPQPETPTERKEFLHAVRSVPRVTDLNGPVEAFYARGVIAGTILRDVVSGSGIGADRVTMSATKKRLANHFAEARLRISVSTIDNVIWPEYRCVAPYWAAYISLYESANRAVPCRPPQLGMFLAMAEEYRKRGETIQTPQSRHGPLLRVGETIMIPMGIKLPAGKLYFSVDPGP